jgi:hypothetical protein
MAEVPPETIVREPPLVVYTRVAPWGFVVALPFAAVLAALGGWALEIGIAHDPTASRLDNPLWIFSIPLLGFALFLFVVGVGELARYVKPTVEVVVDRDGITTYGLMGARHIEWNDLVEMHIDAQHIALRARHKGTPKTVRLSFNRLAIEPARLIRRIEMSSPAESDLYPGPRSP